MPLSESTVLDRKCLANVGLASIDFFRRIFAESGVIALHQHRMRLRCACVLRLDRRTCPTPSLRNHAVRSFAVLVFA